MPEKPPAFLRFAWHHGRRIHKVHQRDVVCIEDLQKAVVLVARIHFQDAARVCRIVSHKTHDLTVEPAETGNQIFGILIFDFKIITIIDQLFNDVVHIVGPIIFIGYDIH